MLLSFCLIFCQFQSGVAYKYAAYKKRVFFQNLMCCNVCCTKLRLKILVFFQKTYSSISNTVGFLFLQKIIFCSSDIFLLFPMSTEPFNLRIMTSMLFNISSIITKTRVTKKIMEYCKKIPEKSREL